jgi:D-glycero-alpha-D-manno-heptose-7-phosphate kinase
MNENITKILESGPIEASAPCRIDMGGTLDISTFYLPLRHLSPCTLNMAIDLRTRVRLLPYLKGMVKVSSRGFKSARFAIDRTPFDHPLGLMFAVAAYFSADGVHIKIESESPPRGALGGSSAASVALIAAFSKIPRKKHEKIRSKKNTAVLAHAIEAGVASVPCGFQDQLAAAYGGVNAWYWRAEPGGRLFRKRTIIAKGRHQALEKHLLVAYCGIPHESRDVNGKWVKQFLLGKNRGYWSEIVDCTRRFVDALSEWNFKPAAEFMNRETAVRRKMTPEVLDEMGRKLAGSAVRHGCGARFTGAGGGGCIWAVGESENISRLRPAWKQILSGRKEAGLLDARIDAKGVN